MTVGAIDIGTNTVLLLVARLDASDRITTLEYEQHVPRLGRNVDARRKLHPASMRRVIDVLLEYRKTLERHKPDIVVVAGTSAVRDAQNSSELSEMIRVETGYELEVLTGEEEANLTYRGAISGVAGRAGATVIDIGGGSTEITIGRGKKITSRVSVNIGSVRMTERFFKHDPPSQEEIGLATTFITKELQRLIVQKLESPIIGVAGTATALAILDQKLPEFHKEAVTNYLLTGSSIEKLFTMLKSLPSQEILGLSAVMEGRHDVITAGALILRAIMSLFQCDGLIVSERGLRYGLAIREWEKYEPWE